MIDNYRILLWMQRVNGSGIGSALLPIKVVLVRRSTASAPWVIEAAPGDRLIIEGDAYRISFHKYGREWIELTKERV